jgi:hypothetical protein
VYTQIPCNEPSSITPITPAEIAAQNADIARIGSKFVSGNQTMSALIAKLTPPPPGGGCYDLTSSLSLDNISPFPWPVPGVPAGGVSGPVSAGASLGLVGGALYPSSPAGLDYPHSGVMADVRRLMPGCSKLPYPWPGSAAAAAGIIPVKPGAVLAALAGLLVLGVAISGGRR